jgi:hypothetical protein
MSRSSSRVSIRSCTPLLLPLLSLLLLLLLVASQLVQGQFAFSAFDSCSATQRLDISGLTCADCGSSQLSDPFDRERCVCAVGFARVVAAADSYAVSCSNCVDRGLVALRDGSACVPCANNATVNADTRDCTCAPGEIIGQRRRHESMRARRGRPMSVG